MARTDASWKGHAVGINAVTDSSVFSPINGFLNNMPPVFQAVLLLIAALLVGWLAQRIAVWVMHRLKVDERLGPKGENAKPHATSSALGKLVFLVVFLLFVP